MDTILALLKQRAGSANEKNSTDDGLMPFALLLMSDVIGASIRAALRSFFSAPAHPFLESATTSDHFDIKPDKSNDEAAACELTNASVTDQISNIAHQLPFDSDVTIDSTPQEPAIVSIRGLRNKGMTCYANSVFQAMASLPSFCKYLQHLELSGSVNLVHELHQTVQYANGHEVTKPKRRKLGSLLSSLSSGSPISYGDPSKVLDIVARHHSQFRSRTGMFAGTSEQQDAHEFFIALMDVLSLVDGHGGVPNMSSVQLDNKLADKESVSLFQNHHNFEKSKRVDNNSISLHGKEFQEEKKHCDDNINTNHYRSESHDFKSSILIGTGPTDLSDSSPFDGWLGSTIKCNTCHHVRPIRSAPFIALSIPLHNNPSFSIERFLFLEYGGFAAAERVSDVLCFSCAIQKRLGELEDEELMLKGAISSIQRRKRATDTKRSDSDILGLLKESERLKARAAALKSIDPDADDNSNDKNFEIDEFALLGLSDKSSRKLQPIRGDAWKATLIMRPPKVLCIHMQRRQFDYRSGRMVKISHHFDFSEVMDLSDFYAFNQQQISRIRTGHRLLYKLMSVIEHQGGAFGGHYQTYRRCGCQESNNSWVLVSDQSVSPRSWNDVKNSQAYMLFYTAM